MNRSAVCMPFKRPVNVCLIVSDISVINEEALLMLCAARPVVLSGACCTVNVIDGGREVINTGSVSGPCSLSYYDSISSLVFVKLIVEDCS